MLSWAAAPPARAQATALPPPFELQGHRGWRGRWPENTLAGFEAALRLGVDTLELDLGLSAEGVPVLSHDPTLNPALTRDASGRWLAARGPAVNTLTVAALQAYDVGRIDPASAYARDYPEQQAVDGARMPTLAALFERVHALGGSAVRYNIETKIDPRQPELTPAPEAFVHALLPVVRAAGVGARVTVQSFDWRTQALVRRQAPELGLGYLTVRARWLDNLADERWTAGLRLQDHGGSVPRLVRAAAGERPGVVWSPFHRNLDPASLGEARALGLRVVPWTVNDPADMQRLLDWGVDGLITDHPERLRERMAARGMPLPPALRG